LFRPDRFTVHPVAISVTVNVKTELARSDAALVAD
jgi:hypothetical protein